MGANGGVCCSGRNAAGRQLAPCHVALIGCSKSSSRRWRPRCNPHRRMSSATAPPPSIKRPSLSELFRAFVIVSISGFGGALPWARRMIVEQKGWMTAEEFNEAFALSQFLPGPNVVNFSVVFGSRFRRCARRRSCARRLDGAAIDHRYGPGVSLCALRRSRSAEPHSRRHHGRGDRASHFGGC